MLSPIVEEDAPVMVTVCGVLSMLPPGLQMVLTQSAAARITVLISSGCQPSPVSC